MDFEARLFVVRSGNWFAAVLKYAYHDTLWMETVGDSNSVLVCSGARGSGI